MTIPPQQVPVPDLINTGALSEIIVDRFSSKVTVDGEGIALSIDLEHSEKLADICQLLFGELDFTFGGLTVEQHPVEWHLRYLFLAPRSGWIQVVLRQPLDVTTISSVSAVIHAADWHEREAEDLFGLHFKDHPRLGDFILHDQVWQEGVAPMRKSFDPHQPHMERRPNLEWKPLLVVMDTGAFAMPVGPVYEGGIGEPIHFMLETVGEDVIRAVPRLFYNYRAVEKIAEGKAIPDALLLAERFAAKSAFAHSLAYCQAVESILRIQSPPRARRLRVLLCELERLRHHAGTIAAICSSTALAVPAAHASIIEEQLLRASCQFSGHRYLFGLNTPGGLLRDFDTFALQALRASVDDAAQQLRVLEKRLQFSSSFLDRLEEVGIVDPANAQSLSLTGPVGRASARQYDLRRDCPYADYEHYDFAVPYESEGDGYARLRVFFAEAYQSARLVQQAIELLEEGPVLHPISEWRAGAALGWAESPIGATMHWVRLDESGKIERYRIMTPSFTNWLGLHVAVEDFAFQDFPIILATFGLSATECDR